MQIRSLPAKVMRRLLMMADDLAVGSNSSFRKFADCYETVRALRRVCDTPVHVVYDIGAATGNWARTLRAFFPTVNQMVLFEPAKEPLATLQKLEIPGVKLTVSELALSAKDGGAVLHGKGPSASLLTATSLQEQFFPTQSSDGIEPVRVASLDAEVRCRGYPSPDLLKLDVQGLEWNVLKGGEETLAACTWLVMELSMVPLYSGQEPFPQILTWLDERGWRLVAIGYQWRSPAGQLLQFDAILTRTSPK